MFVKEFVRVIHSDEIVSVETVDFDVIAEGCADEVAKDPAIYRHIIVHAFTGVRNNLPAIVVVAKKSRQSLIER